MKDPEISLEIGWLADELLDARLSARVVAPPTVRTPGFDVDDGYAVAAALDRRLLARGYRHAGVKIGFTNKAIWPRFGLEEPILAPIYEQTIRGPDDPVSVAAYRAPRVEIEVVFGLDWIDDPVTGDTPPAAGVAWVALGCEVVDCHYPDWHLTPADSVADYGLHGALILGPRIDAGASAFGALLGRLSELRVGLWRNGDIKAEGSGRDVLGHPMAALDALPHLLPRFALDRGAADEMIVSTGTMTPLVELFPGSWQVTAAEVDLPMFDFEVVY